jgi:DNA-binding NtrC family response regulator
MQKRILFVDDEPNVLAGLRRSLYSMREEWLMEFAASGPDALAAMERQVFDVVVTDMRMPGMDGAQLLNEVRERFPQTVRMVLSGQCDREAILNSVGPTHQYLSKPCDAEQLRSKIGQAFALRDLLENPVVQKVVSQLKDIPSLPALYQQILEELRSRDPSPAKVGKLIAKDMGMTAKTLQLVNSAFFGLRCHVSNPVQAANLLGLGYDQGTGPFHAYFLPDRK